MKILIFGGSGHIGSALKAYFQAKGDQVLIIGRRKADLIWDGKNLGDWAKEVDGSDVVINLNGKSVNCRMTDENFKLIMDTRVDSTRVVGQAIQQAQNPPKIWLNASTSTFYKHRFDAPNDDVDGLLEDDNTLPKVWRQSLEVAQAWEDELNAAETPHTRKVAMRIS
ncbi:MAG TPA: NAD-dependent epimerase/dehydratase family protein, partial [Fimbriimonas sp.]|nr:NAD-dependent epimerase/dehydratase family protein [Fimbriimonas sp.]